MVGPVGAADVLVEIIDEDETFEVVVTAELLEETLEKDELAEFVAEELVTETEELDIWLVKLLLLDKTEVEI